MASEAYEAPEGFQKAEEPTSDEDNDYDTEWIDRPAFGDAVRGMLMGVNEDRGKYDSTVLELRLTEPFGEMDEDELVAMWSTGGIDKQLESLEVNRGDELIVVCDDEYEIDGEPARDYSVYSQS